MWTLWTLIKPGTDNQSYRLFRPEENSCQPQENELDFLEPIFAFHGLTDKVAAFSDGANFIYSDHNGIIVEILRPKITESLLSDNIINRIKTAYSKQIKSKWINEAQKKRVYNKIPTDKKKKHALFAEKRKTNDGEMGKQGAEMMDIDI